MKSKQSWILLLVIIYAIIYGCINTTHSLFYQKLLEQDYEKDEIGKMKFLFGDMGGIYPQTLKTNGFVYKVVVLSLSIVESEKTGKKIQSSDINSLFEKYGFVYPEKIWNWEEPKLPLKFDKPAGMLSGFINGTHPAKGKFRLETASFGCGSCHGSLLYNAEGIPTDQFVLGLPNTSLNLDSYAKDIYYGYKKLILTNENEFLEKVKFLFPDMDKEEISGLKIYFKGFKKEIFKIQSTLDQATPYEIGGAGLTNGIGSIKRAMGVFDNYTYHHQEAGFVSIPNLSSRSLRSSLLVSGNYAPEDGNFFEEKTLTDVNDNHVRGLAKIISMFTIGTMGYDDKLAEKAIPDVDDVVSFLKNYKDPKFPGILDWSKVEEGKKIYGIYCQSCHGKYEGKQLDIELISFPNRFISLNEIKTDSFRAVKITLENTKYLEKTRMGKYIDARSNRGYVAPILNGLWATAPYMHNGSVPTLWHFMNPEIRPEKFYTGGHELDFEKMGIKGELKDDVYLYDDKYNSWCDYEMYDTQKLGRSNTGHYEPFDKLSEEEKNDLLEFLKTL